MGQSVLVVDGLDSLYTRMYLYGMSLERQIIQFTAPQRAWLYQEAKTLGVSVAELVRRIVDESRLKQAAAVRNSSRSSEESNGRP